MNQNQKQRLMNRDAAAELRRAKRIDPATFNYMEDVPAWMKYDRMFNAIWDELKTWDINVPTEYEGYCGCAGSHVAAILAAIIDKGLYQPKQVGSLEPTLPEVRV